MKFSLEWLKQHLETDASAEEIAEKAMANYCEYFEMARREFQAPVGKDNRENKAREDLKRLFGD